MADDVTNLRELLDSFDETWSPRIAARVNDWALKVAKVQGSYVWHSHPDTDEVFVVLDGELDIQLRDVHGTERVVHLTRDDVFVVPRGVQHCPVSEAGASVLLVEPADTVSTGDYAGEVPAHIDSTTGR